MGVLRSNRNRNYAERQKRAVQSAERPAAFAEVHALAPGFTPATIFGATRLQSCRVSPDCSEGVPRATDELEVRLRAIVAR